MILESRYQFIVSRRLRKMAPQGDCAESTPSSPAMHPAEVVFLQIERGELTFHRSFTSNPHHPKPNRHLTSMNSITPCALPQYIFARKLLAAIYIKGSGELPVNVPRGAIPAYYYCALTGDPDITIGGGTQVGTRVERSWEGFARVIFITQGEGKRVRRWM